MVSRLEEYVRVPVRGPLKDELAERTPVGNILPPGRRRSRSRQTGSLSAPELKIVEMFF